jgi:hypothetical protein
MPELLQQKSRMEAQTPNLFEDPTMGQRRTTQMCIMLISWGRNHLIISPELVYFVKALLQGIWVMLAAQRGN